MRRRRSPVKRPTSPVSRLEEAPTEVSLQVNDDAVLLSGEADAIVREILIVDIEKWRTHTRFSRTVLSERTVCCDASGMFPILGNRWHKTGEDFDLCEAEYQKLSEVEQQRFELVELVSVEKGVDFAAAMTHYRVAAGLGVAQAAYSLGYM